MYKFGLEIHAVYDETSTRVKELDLQASSSTR
jgi:hypothetical protein